MKRAAFVIVATLWSVAAAPWGAATVTPTSTMAPASAGDDLVARLDAFFARIAPELPHGAEVLIERDGREIYAKRLGAWRPNAQVPIASGTKWYSGAVIMSLVDEGRLSLDDRASRYLPYLTGDKATITVRQLMSHTSGFPGEFPLADRCLSNPRDTLEHCAQALAQVPLRAQPGTAFIYSGAGMQIAGRVAEVAAGKDWQTLFRERIAQPLGMAATDYAYLGPTRNPRISGGGRSTVRDYMAFLTMVEQGGVYRGRRVLSAAAIETMLRDQTGGAAIVQSPFARRAAGDPQFAGSRYGIGNWLEDPDASGHASWHSSPGALGWTPAIDSRRHLRIVVGVRDRRFLVHYAEFKRLLNGGIAPEPSAASDSHGRSTP